MEAHSLYELNEYVKRVIALNFREPLWIKAEASQVNFSRNNYYIDLVEKKEGKDEIIAQASAVIWARNYYFLKKKLGDVLDEILVDGTEILIKVKIDFNERYGLKLFIEDIDPSYTFGQAELRRQQIIEQLKSEGLHELNSQIPLPNVLQKIAVLSSESAAGYEDFANQLTQNSYGYHYEIELFPIAVQGTQLESQLIHALDSIEEFDGSFDCVVLIRGGGSRLDLSWFDTYPIGEKIARCSYPVFTGIGHEIDYSIADLTAHTNLKTPTAVADFLIEHNLFFESNMIEMMGKIFETVGYQLRAQDAFLDKFLLTIMGIYQQKISSAKHVLESLESNIFSSSCTALEKASNELAGKENLLLSLMPENVLKRGYTIIYKADKSMHSKKDLIIGDKFEVQFRDGKINSERI